MLDTNNTKDPHKTRGYFSIGSGPIKILILGSCRVLGYANYFSYLNRTNCFTINLVNVVNFWMDEQGRTVEPDRFATRFEKNHDVLKMISETRWFLHEHTESFGMFNTSKQLPKHIYQFGMNAAVDISLPNFHNIFILFQDILEWNQDFKTEAKSDIAKTGDLSTELKQKILNLSEMQLNHFLGICRKTNVSEFADLFESQWRLVRYFWTINHISAAFSGDVFRIINEKFLQLDLEPWFWEKVRRDDLYENPHSPITKYDIECHGLKWPQPVENLNLV